MDHNDLRHKLSEYIDGAVTPQERAAVEEHLGTCTECADALRELRKTIEQVKQLDEVDAPAWMTSTVMARVRAEAAEKKSLFHRLFYPLAVKLPLQAVAMLFLAVTAFYLYQGMHPAAKFAGTPREAAKMQEAPSAGVVRDEQKPAPDAAERAKEVAQTPGYRSLDMKYSYEKPAPPVPEAREAVPFREPAPAEPAAQPLPAGKAGPFAPQAAAPGTAARAMRAEQEARPGTPKGEDAGKEGKAGTSLSAGTGGPGTSDLNRQQAKDREAEETLSVTEHFVRYDLKEAMKIRGLQFSARRVPADLAGTPWLSDMSAYRSRPCTRRYLVDVELSGNSSKYLYCYDRAHIELLGIFEQVQGIWREQK